MATPSSERVAEIVEAALERTLAEREQFLEEACAGDVLLRTEVESLLGFQDRARTFIESPAYEIASTILVEKNSELTPGQRLGDYNIVSLLGEGGMGEVYLAMDTKLQRHVAIKIVKHGLGSPKVLHDLRKEERILAGLNHPNIARLYGAEVTPAGLPYFVMEYVEGRRLDQYCCEQELAIPDRLAIFRKICAAITYAHQNLIIHRDIKPANIRVTVDGEPKLLDFGIAKLLDPETSTAGESTMTFAAVMTPEYASPEQIRAENITTASDVYSLGVVLYELLTGQRPYKITTRNPTEIARVITETEPARPSIAVVRLQDSSLSG
jgi:serine/threonine protein kinase